MLSVKAVAARLCAAAGLPDMALTQLSLSHSVSCIHPEVLTGLVHGVWGVQGVGPRACSLPRAVLVPFPGREGVGAKGCM